MLHVSHLSFQRNGGDILRDVSFDVPDGSLLIISGPNGVGKSTLLRILAGVEGGTEGLSLGALCDAQGSLAELAPEERFRRGMLLTFQEPPVLAGVTFFTVAREMLFARTGVRPEVSALYAELRTLFARLHLAESFIERSLFEGFSGGEKKRIELAFLLLAKPRIALLDEIDAGLDADGRVLAQDVLRELLSSGASVVCVTHNPDFLQDFPQKTTLFL